MPTFEVQRRLLYDPVSGTILTHAQLQNDTSIYSSDMFSCDTSAKTCTHLVGNGDDSNAGGGNFPASTPGGWQNGTACTPDCPGTRHPDFMTTIDTLRNVYAQYSGLIFGNPTTGGAQGNFWNDFWEFGLHANPLSNTWNKVSAVNADIGAGAGGGIYNAVMVYWSPDDIYWLWGGPGDDVYVMCRTATMSANQTAAGCVSQYQWAMVQGTAPAPINVQVNLKNAHYDPATGKILVWYWDTNTGGSGQEALRLFTYAPLTKAWAEVTLSGAVPVNQLGATHSEWLVNRISAGPHAGLFHYHRTGHRQTASPAWAADYLINTVTGVVTQITAIGSGPSAISFSAYDPTVGAHGTVVMHEMAAGGMGYKVWHGTFQTP
jgi:hypothetical protein